MPCRVFPDGKVQYLHPLDGVYPEKVNAGRVGVNQNMRSIGENVNPIKVRAARQRLISCQRLGVGKLGETANAGPCKQCRRALRAPFARAQQQPQGGP